MLRKLQAMQGFFISPKMRIADWALGLTSIVWGLYALTAQGSQGGWIYLLGGVLGCASAHYRVAERMQARLRKSMVRMR